MVLQHRLACKSHVLLSVILVKYPIQIRQWCIHVLHKKWIEYCILIIEYPTKFPYLNTPDLSDAQRKKLKRRLKKETNKMIERFAILIGRTLSSLRKHEVSIGELKALLKNLNGNKKNKLTNRLKKVTVISKAFEECYLISGPSLITIFWELLSQVSALI